MYKIQGINMPGKASLGHLFNPIRDREEFLRKITFPKTLRWDRGSLMGMYDQKQHLQTECDYAELISPAYYYHRPGLVSVEKLDSYYWMTNEKNVRSK